MSTSNADFLTRRLLGTETDVDYTSGVVLERNSLLNLAIIAERVKISRWLIEEKGADLESSDRGGFTPLINA